MNKYVLTLRTGSEFEPYHTEFVCFEAQSKEDLIFDLNIALLEYDSLRSNIVLWIHNLEDKARKLLEGSHKKAPDRDSYRVVWEEIKNKQASIEYILFQNRKFNWKYFYYEDSQRSNGRINYILEEVKDYQIQTLDDWFKQRQGDLKD